MTHSMKTAIITGCDSGIGRSLCEVFLAHGYTLIISYLKNNPFEKNRKVFAKKTDLRRPDNTKSFITFARSRLQQGCRLEYFINNAGVALGGPVECVPISIYREVFEINYFALVRLSRAFIPDLKQTKGTIGVIGSLAGKVALPFLSPYVSSKFAVEGFCDSLRRELNPFGIKTVLFEPGAVATPIWERPPKQDSLYADSVYGKSLGVFKTNFIDQGKRGMDASKAAVKMYALLAKKKPSPRYLIDQCALSAFLKTLIPDRLLDAIVVRLFSMNYGGNQQPRLIKKIPE